MKNKENKHVTGILGLTFDGYGFVVPEQEGEADVFIPAHAIGDALHRDRVEVTVQKGRMGKTEGRIAKILERGMKQVVGRYEIRGKGGIVVTEDLRVKRMVTIPSKHECGARHNEMVIAKITEYPLGNKPIAGEVIKRLGQRGSDKTELKILMACHQLPEDFPNDVRAEAERTAKSFTPQPKAHQSQAEARRNAGSSREDLTRLPFVTIDGEDAKDFDDAVCAKKNNDGSVHVWVSIADVSNFVREGSRLDTEAARRATSVYLPGFCIPMLPEALSNDICSLVPDEERYCFTAEMDIDPNGITHNSRFYKSVIKSRYRMTYTEVNNYLTHHQPPETSPEVINSLDMLNTAALFFRKQRTARGSIDFDLPEPAIVLDLTGKPENIIKAERNIAHMLVEDLMIAANEAVAVFLTRKGYPCVYRVHDQPDPDKLTELMVLLKYLGHDISLGRDPTPKKLANVVRTMQGRPEERLINMLTLRSMAQAVYSTKNVGHFGLASKCYCHFTSPIRRYPDLLIHRLLADALRVDQQKKVCSQKYLAKESDNCSKMERRSMEAERESLSLFTAMFMRDKIGEVYDGLVSHTAKKGIFVELIEYFVEGLIEPLDLVGDKYVFEPKKFSFVGQRTHRSIHIGDKIKVAVKDVSIEERRVYFEPV